MAKPKDLDKSEIKWITKLGKNTFNKVGKSHDHRLNYKTQPWFSGAGARCLSDCFMFTAIKIEQRKHNGYFDEVLSIRSSMTIEQRCAYEVEIYMQAFDCHKQKMRKWFDRCRDNLLLVLCNG